MIRRRPHRPKPSPTANAVGRIGAVFASTVLLASTALIACTAEPPSTDEARPTSGLALSLEVSADTDVAAVRLRAARVPCEDGQAVDPVEVEAEAGSARRVDAREAVSAGTDRAAGPALADTGRRVFDDILALAPGCYDLDARPVDATGEASADCAPTGASDLSVVDGAITPVFLWSQCQGSGAGALDAVVALNQPPSVIGIQYETSRFTLSGQSLTLCARAADPDGQRIEIEWTVVTGPEFIEPESVQLHDDGATSCASFTPRLLGDYLVAITAYDLVDHGGASERVEDVLARTRHPRPSQHTLTAPFVAVEAPAGIELPARYPSVRNVDGRLAFVDYAAFQRTIETLMDVHQRHQAIPGAGHEDLLFADFETRLDFDSLRAEIARERARFFGEGDDPDDHFVPDSYFRTVLNPDLEVQIGDAIYVVRSDHTLELPAANAALLETIRDPAARLPDGLIRHDHDPNTNEGPDGQGQRGKDCKSNSGCTKKHVYEANRRFKSRNWVFNSWIYSSAGGKTRAQRKNSGGGAWVPNAIDRVEMVIGFSFTDSSCEEGPYGAGWDVVRYDKSKAEWSYSWWGQITKVLAMVSYHAIADRNVECSRWLDLFDCDNSPVTCEGSNAPVNPPQSQNPNGPITAPRAIHNVDVDGDSRSDIIFVGQGWSGPGLNIRVKRSNGDGTWTHWSEILPDGAGVHTYPTLTGDVDGDGRTDVIFVGQNWSGPGLNIRVKRSNGDGSWTPWSQVMGDGAGVHSHPAHTGDVDGDGRTDLIFIGQGWSGGGLNIRVKRSNGDGTWTSWSQIHGDGAGVHTHRVHTGDVDGDGRTDLIFVGQNWSGTGLNIRVKRSNGDGTWTHWSQIHGDGGGVHVHPSHVGDVDGDGRTDLVFVGQNWSGSGLNIRVKRSNGDGTWTHWSDILPDGGGVHAYPAHIGDVDGDGRDDLVFVGQGWSGTGLNIRVKRSNGDGTWTLWSDIHPDGSGVHTYPAFGMNVDDGPTMDLVFIGQGWSAPGLNIRSKISNGDGTFTAVSDLQPDGSGVHTYPALAGTVP